MKWSENNYNYFDYFASLGGVGWGGYRRGWVGWGAVGCGMVGCGAVGWVVCSAVGWVGVGG